MLVYKAIQGILKERQNRFPIRYPDVLFQGCAGSLVGRKKCIKFDVPILFHICCDSRLGERLPEQNVAKKCNSRRKRFSV